MKTEKRILILDQYSFVGGGQTILVQIARAIQNIPTVEQVIFAIPFGGALEDKIRRDFPNRAQLTPIPEVKISQGKKNLFDGVRLLTYTLQLCFRLFLEAFKSDVLYANGPRLFPAVMILSTLLRKPAIYHIHMDYSGLEKRLISLAIRLPYTRSAVAISDFVLERLADSRPELLGHSKLVKVENSLSQSFERLPWKDRFENRLGPINLVCLGVIRPEKGQDLLVDFVESDPRFHLHIVGREGSGCEQWVESLRKRAASNVTFHPFSDDILSLLDQVSAQIVLVPSRSEGFGLVAIEAMAASCLTVVRATGGLPEVAQKTGALVFQDSVADLRVLMNQLVQKSSSELAHLSRDQYERTLKHYGTARFEQDLARLFQ